jgi:hypothetical protein
VITLKETKLKIENDAGWWRIHLMNFVDDFRCHKDLGAVQDPFHINDMRMDALLAATAESLEIGLEPPE